LTPEPPWEAHNCLKTGTEKRHRYSSLFGGTAIYPQILRKNPFITLQDA